MSSERVFVGVLLVLLSVFLILKELNSYFVQIKVLSSDWVVGANLMIPLTNI